MRKVTTLGALLLLALLAINCVRNAPQPRANENEKQKAPWELIPPGAECRDGPPFCIAPPDATAVILQCVGGKITSVADCDGPRRCTQTETAANCDRKNAPPLHWSTAAR